MSPIRGCIPAGGSTPLTIQLCADIEGHFDSFLNIALKEGKKLSLRFAGTVEPPQVYIDLVITAIYIYMSCPHLLHLLLTGSV